MYFIGIFILIALIQLAPLPRDIINIFSPLKLFLQNKGFAAFDSFGASRLSFYALAVKQELVKFIVYFLVFLGVLNLINKKKQFKRLFILIIIGGVGLSLYGVLRKYYFAEETVVNSFSTFGNKNHFAAYITMIAPISLGFALYYRDFIKKTMFGLGCVFMVFSILFSFSRAGALCSIFSLFLMIILLRGEKVIKSKRFVISIIAAFGIGLILLTGVEPIRNNFFRLIFDKEWNIRWMSYQNSFLIIKDFPFLGIGMGNFGHVFPVYQSFSSYFNIYHLHSDHLQLVVEMGLIGAFAYFAFIFCIFKDMFWQLQKRQDPFIKTIFLGAFCGLIGVFMHGFVDFHFRIPAVSFLFWLIIGLVYKGIYTNFQNSESDAESEGKV